MSLATEDEAIERWCPFSRYSSDASNRWHVQARRNPDTNEKFEGFTEPNPVQCRCIASHCMAWRWEQIRQPVPSKYPRAESQVKLVQGERGWCGLAGNPSGRGPFG